MPNEIYHRSEWGKPKSEDFGDVYFDASATNKLYKHSDNYENSDGTDKILRDIPNKASIVLTPTAYSDGSLNTVLPTDGNGDFDFSRGSSATRVNEKGLIEDVASNIPRIDYTGGTGALLLEPQSTNLVTYSEQFGGQTDYFNVYNQSSQVSNNNLAPDGTNTATQIVSTGAGKLQTNYISLPANTTYTLSFYAKNVDATEVYSRILADGGSGGSNLTSVSYISQINTSSWNRITHIFTTNSTSQSYILYLSSALNSGGNIQLWGAQLEQKSFATSYIPTEGSTVTRSADVANNSGNADLFNDSEGVLYAEISALANYNLQRWISISDNTHANTVKLGLYNNATNFRFAAEIRAGGTRQALMTYDFGAITPTMTKIAVKYKENDFALWINGVEVATDTSGNTPIGLSRLQFDRGDGSPVFEGKVKSLAVFKEALTDEELQALTT